jgi:hypothetical protein
MSFDSIINKILKTDQLKALKYKNLQLQETFDNKISKLSQKCGTETTSLLLSLRIYSREHQLKLINSSLLDLNTNIKNELNNSIDIYEKLINNITNCSSLSSSIQYIN